MRKLLIQTALKSALMIFILTVVVAAVTCLGFPQTMANYAEGFGNYKIAASFATLQYKYTNDVEDLARVVEDSILCGNDKNIVVYGEKLVKHDNFSTLCDKKDALMNEGDYFKFVTSKVALSKYSLKGMDNALAFAKEVNGNSTFKNGNALMALSVKAVSQRDISGCLALKGALNALSPQASEDQILLNDVLSLLNTIG